MLAIPFYVFVQDGNVLIKNARIDDIKRFNDGTLYIEVYAKERLLSVLPAKNGLNYLNMYVRKDNYLTYNGESYKRIDDENKSITWKDGSKSPYGQRITLFDRLEPYLLFGMLGGLISYVLFVEWKIKRKPLLLLARLDSHGVVVLFLLSKTSP